MPDGRVVHELLRGIPLTTACLHRAVGAEGAELLHQAGFVIAIGDWWRLAFWIASVNGALFIAPHGIPVTALRNVVTGPDAFVTRVAPWQCCRVEA